MGATTAGINPACHRVDLAGKALPARPSSADLSSARRSKIAPLPSVAIRLPRKDNVLRREDPQSNIIEAW